MDKLNPELERILAAKEARRNRLAALPIQEKIRILVKLQEMAAPILRQRGKWATVWKVEEKNNSDNAKGVASR